MSEPDPAPAVATLRQSKTFCEGYGDFGLQSSDGVVFYISRFLLAYASPVFRDMFDLGERLQPSSQSEDKSYPGEIEPVSVSEDAVTIDLLLRHIDPKQSTRPLEEGTVAQLLEAGRKYQVGIVLTWFEEEAVKRVEYPNLPVPGVSLIRHNPLLVLSLAIEYGLGRLAQQATCALVTGEASLLLRNVNIRLDVYRYVYGQREARVQWYMERIGAIAGKLSRGKPVTPGICASCSNTRSAWIHKLTETVLKTPLWAAFAAEVTNPIRRCRPGCGDWALQMDEDMTVWSHEATSMELILPTLPF